MNANLFHHLLRAGAAVLIGAIPLSSAVSQATGSAPEIQPPAQGAWPKAEPRHGRYFSYVLPVGWKVSESTNGVDLTSPDESEGISFVGLEGTPGSSSPRAQIEWIAQILKLSTLSFLQTVSRPPQNGFETAEFLFSYTDPKGRPCQGWAWSAVNNSFGHTNTYTELAWSVAGAWGRDAQFMVAAARLVSVTNPEQAFQRDQLIRLRVPAGPGSAGGFNHPNTFTPHSNQAAMDRISAQRSNTTRDDYPLVDPSTGRTYHGTSGNYDYVRGGWVNPLDRTQLLKPVVPPGQ